MKLEQASGFQKSILLSLSVHLIVILFFILKGVFLNSSDIDFSQAIRVDMVDLPDKVKSDVNSSPAPQATVQPLPPKETAPEPAVPMPKVETKIPSPTAPKEKKKVDLEKQAINKIKSQSAIEKIKEDLMSESKDKAKSSAKPIYKGQVLSPGTALSGLNKLQHDSYLMQIDAHVKQFWILPQWMSQANLKARVRVKIDEHGNVIAKEIAKSSGNEAYDEHVLETVKKASPFPPPPAKFVDVVEIEGIVLGFPE